MYYSNGNYEAFARPEKPEGVDRKSAYLVGGGLWGSIALIGPTRMPFQKLMPLLHTFADQLGEGMSGKRKDTPQAAAPRRTVIYKEDLE